MKYKLLTTATLFIFLKSSLVYGSQETLYQDIGTSDQIRVKGSIAYVLDCASPVLIPEDEVEAKELPFLKELENIALREEVKVIGFATEIPNFPPMLQVIKNIVQEKKIVIVAAGNEGKALGRNNFKSHLIDLVTDEDVKPYIVLVGRLKKDEFYDKISPVSNRAGMAKEHFITALSYEDQGLEGNGLKGTYACVETVSQAIGDLLAEFPQISPCQVIETIFQSAIKEVYKNTSDNEKEGFLLKPEVYGQGQLHKYEAHNKLKALIDDGQEEELEDTSYPLTDGEENEEGSTVLESQDGKNDFSSLIKDAQTDLAYTEGDYQENHERSNIVNHEDEKDELLQEASDFASRDHHDYANQAEEAQDHSFNKAAHSSLSYFTVSIQLTLLAVIQASKGFCEVGKIVLPVVVKGAANGYEMGKAVAPSVGKILLRVLGFSYQVGKIVAPVMGEVLIEGSKLLGRGMWRLSQGMYRWWQEG